MSEFKSIETVAEYITLDDEEVVAGYRAGRRGDPEPGNTFSRSYWHGWRNGAADSKVRKLDASQRRLAADIAARMQHSSRLQ